MPRNKTVVKNKTRPKASRIAARSTLRSSGLVDLHFHGAYGIDLMTAGAAELDELSRRLALSGIAGFCPTTLSAPPAELEQSVARLGAWIESGSAAKSGGARPLGIHLEGPFLHPDACGAHPPSCLRPLSLEELERLWKASRGTIRIITLAPERLGKPELKALCTWAQKRGIRLSLGHSHATEAEAGHAFDAGFSGVTHAWNALPFHHRAPGPLGAALGRAGTHVELIIDRVHVSPDVIRWTLDLHPEGVCFVSDCAPAAGTSGGRWCSFGSLKTRFQDGACRLEGGALAGGGLLLPEALRSWLSHEQATDRAGANRLFRSALPCATLHPTKALGLSPSQAKSLLKPKLSWSWQPGGNWELHVGVD